MRYGFLFALFKRSHDHLRGFLIAAWAGDKIAEFSFPEISFHFPLRPWFFFVSPAYAGKSASSASHERMVEDHPRICGEKGNVTLCELFGQGSPPRMRGKACGIQGSSPPSGITPAYAGKRPAAHVRQELQQDHPRVCGEKTELLRRKQRLQGSPPRMRGKDVARLMMFSILGITPAYAGKRVPKSAFSAAVKDHPRVCGEKRPEERTRQKSIGSPPRMRGKVLFPETRKNASRITPAYAGKRQ